jgi:hypothetical protein
VRTLWKSFVLSQFLLHVRQNRHEVNLIDFLKGHPERGSQRWDQCGSMGVISARRDTFLCMTFFEIWWDRNSTVLLLLEHTSFPCIFSIHFLFGLNWILFVVSISRHSAIWWNVIEELFWINFDCFLSISFLRNMTSSYGLFKSSPGS